MTKNDSKTVTKKKSRKRRLLVVFLIFLILVAAGAGGLYLYNNISFTDDREFTRQVDASIAGAQNWVQAHQQDIRQRGNVALLRMLWDSSTMRPEADFDQLVNDFLSGPAKPACWKGLLDRHYKISPAELKRTIESEVIDNRWVLYAIAPDIAALSEDDQAKLRDADRWQGRKLTHQLNALTRLNERQPADWIGALSERLCDRITAQLRWDMAVIDLYIQKVAFVMDSGHPEKINRRWIERIIQNQQPDGGWDDRWFIFQSRRRPTLDFKQPTNQHATVQALWLLYMVKYRYGDQLGVLAEAS